MFGPLSIYPPTYLPTYVSTHPPISYNLPTFVFHSLVMICQNKHVNEKIDKKKRLLIVWSIGQGIDLSSGTSRVQFLTL
jgi:hypothetical protein